jgi:capsular polysaccharide biosynthesis protein
MKTKTIDDFTKEQNSNLNIILEPIRMSYDFPNTIDNVQDLFANILFKPPRALSNRLFNTKIHNVYINNGRIIDKNHEFEIKDFCSASSSFSNKNPSTIIENAVHLSSNWGGSNYWHWMASSLSRLSLFDKIPLNTTYIINSLNHKFVVDSLSIIGIKSEKLIEIDKLGCVFCKNLLLPSLMGDFDKKGFLFLRDKIKKQITPFTNAKNRIFISRRKTRIVENENEIMNLLQKLNFKLIRCENLSFEEQIKTFYNAEIIIAPHGAGLTNLIFAGEEAKVLELRSPNYFGRCYYYLSNHLGFKYYSLYGEGKIPTTKEEVGASLHSNMKINIDRLKQTLDLMDIK